MQPRNSTAPRFAVYARLSEPPRAVRGPTFKSATDTGEIEFTAYSIASTEQVSLESEQVAPTTSAQRASLAARATATVTTSRTVVDGLAGIFPSQATNKNIFTASCSRFVDDVIGGQRVAVLTIGNVRSGKSRCLFHDAHGIPPAPTQTAALLKQIQQAQQQAQQQQQAGQTQKDPVIDERCGIVHHFGKQLYDTLGKIWNEDDDDNEVILRTVVGYSAVLIGDRLYDGTPSLPLDEPAITIAEGEEDSCGIASPGLQRKLQGTTLKWQQHFEEYVSGFFDRIWRQRMQLRPQNPDWPKACSLFLWFDVKSTSPARKFYPDIVGTMLFSEVMSFHPVSARRAEHITVPEWRQEEEAKDPALGINRVFMSVGAMIARQLYPNDKGIDRRTSVLSRLLAEVLSASTTRWITVAICCIRDESAGTNPNEAERDYPKSTLNFARLLRQLNTTVNPVTRLSSSASLSPAAPRVILEKVNGPDKSAATAGVEDDSNTIIKVVTVDLSKCLACQTAESTHAFLPCGHRAVCPGCAGKFKCPGDKCPVPGCGKVTVGPLLRVFS